MSKMKAYIASDRNGDEGLSIVVFAESAGKAKSYTVGKDEFCDYDFTDIRVTRNPSLDRFYHGKSEMDWFDPEERIAMVRYANFSCTYELSDAECKCQACEAQRWCDRYQNMHDNVWLTEEDDE